MRRAIFLVLALLGAASLSCADRSSPTATGPIGRLEVFVGWDGVGQADRLLEILELGLAQRTDSAGKATFELPVGSYTLRAHINSPGPPFPHDVPVTTKANETVHVDFVDCVPCMTPH